MLCLSACPLRSVPNITHRQLTDFAQVQRVFWVGEGAQPQIRMSGRVLLLLIRLYIYEARVSRILTLTAQFDQFRYRSLPSSCTLLSKVENFTLSQDVLIVNSSSVGFPTIYLPLEFYLATSLFMDNKKYFSIHHVPVKREFDQLDKFCG